MEITPVHGRGRTRAHIVVGIDLTPSRHSAPAIDLRSTSTITRTGRTRAPHFRETLQAAGAVPYTVRRGDTLSEIVHDHLKSQGAPISGTELYERVREVARANGIADPNVITPGQRIDLNALDGQGGPRRSAASKRDAAPPIVPAPPRSSVSVSRSLEDIIPGETRITSTFGLRSDPFDGGMRHHRGVDVAARRGSPIYPVEEGLVVFSGWHGGHGKTVIVRHDDGTETVYAHADTLLVKEGDEVQVNDKLGLVGSTGRSTGPHLHFEVRKSGVPVDPLAALGDD